MNLRRLEYFLILAQTGNLRRASEILHISAPALSKAMKVMEEEFETALWIRDGRRIVLTDSGQAVLKKVPYLIEAFQTLKHNLKSTLQAERPIKIATFEVFSTYFLSFLEKIRWNDRALELHELLPGEVEKYISEGALDLGITYLPVPDPQLDFLKVTSIEMGVFTRQGAFENIQQKDLPFVVPVMPMHGVPTRVKGLDGWPADAYVRRIVHRVALLESALELCRQGRVAGYFPIFIVREHNNRVRDEFRLERRKSPYAGRVCSSDVYLVKRKSYEETIVVKQLAKAIRLICV